MDWLLSVVRFMQSVVGIVVLALLGGAAGTGAWLSGVPLEWAVISSVMGTLVVMCLLALPGLDPIQIRYKLFLWNQIQSRPADDESRKRYRHWWDLPELTEGPAAKERNRWYERLFDD